MEHREGNHQQVEKMVQHRDIAKNKAHLKNRMSF